MIYGGRSGMARAEHWPRGARSSERLLGKETLVSTISVNLSGVLGNSSTTSSSSNSSSTSKVAKLQKQIAQLEKDITTENSSKDDAQTKELKVAAYQMQIQVLQSQIQELQKQAEQKTKDKTDKEKTQKTEGVGQAKKQDQIHGNGKSGDMSKVTPLQTEAETETTNVPDTTEVSAVVSANGTVDTLA